MSRQMMFRFLLIAAFILVPNGLTLAQENESARQIPVEKANEALDAFSSNNITFTGQAYKVTGENQLEATAVFSKKHRWHIFSSGVIIKELSGYEHARAAVGEIFCERGCTKSDPVAGPILPTNLRKMNPKIGPEDDKESWIKRSGLYMSDAKLKEFFDTEATKMKLYQKVTAILIANAKNLGLTNDQIEQLKKLQ